MPNIPGIQNKVWYFLAENLDFYFPQEFPVVVCCEKLGENSRVMITVGSGFLPFSVGFLPFSAEMLPKIKIFFLRVQRPLWNIFGVKCIEILLCLVF